MKNEMRKHIDTFKNYLNENKEEIKMKIGDKVKISDKNPNHLGRDVSAYADMEGIVTDLWEDGSFAIKTPSSVLVVPLHNKDGIWIYLNDMLIFHKKNKKSKNWLDIFKW